MLSFSLFKLYDSYTIQYREANAFKNHMHNLFYLRNKGLLFHTKIDIQEVYNAS